MNYKIFYIKDKPEFIDICSINLYNEFKIFYNILGITSHKELSVELRSKFLNTNSLPFTIIALTQDNCFAGCASLEVNDMNIQPQLSPWITDLFVVSSYRRKGVGKSLIQFLITKSKQLKIEKLYLWTDIKHNFFKTIGFEDFIKNDIRYLNFKVKVMSIYII